MPTIYGTLGLNETDNLLLNTIGQQTIYDAVNSVMAEFSAAMQGAMSMFVDADTTNYKERYKLPGAGKLQKMGQAALAQPANVKAVGSWDVAYPLEEFSDSLGVDRVTYAYMTLNELQRHVTTIQNRYMNSTRHEILRALFRATALTWVDEQYGSLSIQPLASGDGTLYPPVIGSEAFADDTHLLESGYTAGNISDSNNPYVTISGELEEHFGTPTGGSNIVCFVNHAQTAKTKALTDFIETEKLGIQLGDDTARAVGLPAAMPGRILGRESGAGVWVVEWRWVPANYIIGIHMEAPKPLKRRVDSVQGLGSGALQLIAENDKTPLLNSIYSARFGFGVANRLNGVVLELGTGGSYTVPTGY